MVIEEVPILKLGSKENSSVLSSLRRLVEANGQQDLQRHREFKELRTAGVEAVRELQGIHKLHGDLLDDGRSRDSALTGSMRSISTKLDDFVKFGSKIATENMILESLCYKSMAVRHEKIVDAHAETFEWIFHKDSLRREFPKERTFVDWLAHGNNVFWIKGKAGSGKSTLMKFLSHHPETKKALEPWFKQQKLVLASFYFWAAGTELQKSQEGLLQSLLYEILRQCPESIPVAVPQRWERCFQNKSSSDDWTCNELATALRNLTSGRMLSCRFCCFIDGLDEYYGDHRVLVDLIQNFTKSEDIKFCLSSRPWNVFELAFRNGFCPQLRLEDLTKEDIRHFVRDKLEDDDAFRKFRERESEACDHLVNEVVQRAHGVFLWVFLVVRSLTSGLANADRVVDLQRRLDSLPDDLEEYFKHMLDTIDRTYLQQTAQTFQVALESEPLNLMTYCMLDELETSPEYALNLECRVMSEMNVRSRHHDMKLRINARCKDLLEVTRVANDNTLGCIRGAELTQSLPESILDYQVDFLHRTVRDFFHTKYMDEWVGANVSEEFDYNLSLCAAFVAQIKNASLDPITEAEVRTLSDLAIGMGHYAHRTEIHMGVPPTALLDSLFKLVVFEPRRMGKVTSASDAHIRGIKIPVRRQQHGTLGLLHHSTLAFATYHDLRLYVAEKLHERWGQVSLSDRDEPLIQAALHPYTASNNRKTSQSCNDKMLYLLMSKGVAVIPHLMLKSSEHELVACVKLYSSWAEMTHSLSDTHAEQLNGSLDSGLRFAQGPRSLQWVIGVLKSLESYWRYTMPNGALWCHQGDLTEVMMTLLQRGLSPNWSYGRCTIWIYFVVSLARSELCLDSRILALKLAKELVRCGASLEQDMSVACDELTSDVTDTDVPWDGSVTHSNGELSARELLQKVFLEGEMEELMSVGKANKKESARDAKKRRKKQKEKSKSRKRRKQG